MRCWLKLRGEERRHDYEDDEDENEDEGVAAVSVIAEQYKSDTLEVSQAAACPVCTHRPACCTAHPVIITRAPVIFSSMPLIILSQSQSVVICEEALTDECPQGETISQPID